MARQVRVAGQVRVDVVIGAEGAVENVHMVNGNTLLTRSAVNALKKWRFAPIMAGGKPTRVVASFTFDFLSNTPTNREFTGQLATGTVFVATTLIGPAGEAGKLVNITKAGLEHVLERHAVGGVKAAGKSLFHAGETFRGWSRRRSRFPR